jgi:hypothetical protein
LLAFNGGLIARGVALAGRKSVFSKSVLSVEDRITVIGQFLAQAGINRLGPFLWGGVARGPLTLRFAGIC